MFACKVCKNPFEMIDHVPKMMKCGHTFCKICILQSIQQIGYFPCENCFYHCADIDHVTTNHILCDRTSLLENLKSKSRADVEVEEEEENEVCLMQSNQRNFKHMVVEEMLREDFQNSMRFPQSESQNKINYQNKCLLQSCNRFAEGDFCSTFCQQRYTNTKNTKSQFSVGKLMHNQHQFGQSTVFQSSLTKSKNLSFYSPNFAKMSSQFSKGKLTSKSKNRQKCLRKGCQNWRRSDRGPNFEFCGEDCFTMCQKQSAKYKQLYIYNFSKQKQIKILIVFSKFFFN